METDPALQLIQKAHDVTVEENMGPRSPSYIKAREVVALERIAAALEHIAQRGIEVHPTSPPSPNPLAPF